MSIRKYGRSWAVIDADGTLVCLCVYRKGALEVVRRLHAQEKQAGEGVIRPGAQGGS